MKLVDQVCTLEQAKRLKELGVAQESTWFWETMKPHTVEGLASERLSAWFNVGHPISTSVVEDWFSAFTVAELGAMLPMNLTNENGNAYGIVHIREDDGFRTRWNFQASFLKPTEAQARAAMLIFLLDKKHIEVTLVNQLLTA